MGEVVTRHSLRPLFMLGVIGAKLGHSCRGNVHSCLSVIASAAKQSKARFEALDCFVGIAPRNDEIGDSKC
jgi:hypothetical protein